MEEKTVVRVDWFIADAMNIEIPVSQELMACLIGNAAQYLKANPGGMPWEKWSLLSEASRAAFTEAASQLKVRESIDVPQ